MFAPLGDIGGLYFLLIRALAYVVILPELFTTQTRYTGVAISYNISFSIAGLLPTLLSVIITYSHAPLNVPFIFIGFSLFTIMSLSTYQFNTALGLEKPLSAVADTIQPKCD